MADVLIQFHALADELVAFVREAVAEVPVHLTAFRFAPFDAVALDADDLEPTLRDESVREIAFTLGPPALAIANSNEFLDRNADALRLDIGRISEAGLRESCLSARTTDERALHAWRKLARKLRKA